MLVAFAFVSVSAGAQSLMDDQTYRELVETADERSREAQVAFDEGRYDDAAELSREAKALTARAEEYAQERVLRYRANAFRNRARDRIRVADRLKAQERYPDEWSSAKEFYREGEDAFEDRSWETSIDSFRSVMTALESVKPVPFSPAPTPPPPPPKPEPEAVVEEVVEEVKEPPILGGYPPVEISEGRVVTTDLPALYFVRLIPGRRDCFWRIAEYPFVYGDPWKWRTLYLANKEKLQDPGNPHLIQPGMLFVIPEIEGEEREGVWIAD
jgi:nucleoid-associated protein YgaU